MFSDPFVEAFVGLGLMVKREVDLVDVVTEYGESSHQIVLRVHQLVSRFFRFPLSNCLILATLPGIIRNKIT